MIRGADATDWSWQYVEVDNSRPSASFGIDAGDLSGDGFADIVSGRYFYRSPGGDLAGRWTRVEFPVEADAVASLDVDGDNRGDVIAISCSGVFWIEALDRAGNSWTSRKVNDRSFCDHGIGAQGYCRAQIVAGGSDEVCLLVDGQIVCLKVPANPLDVMWPLSVIAEGAVGTDGCAAADIDGDRDLDVTTGLSWWRNPGNLNAPWEKSVIASFSSDVDRVAAADFDGDHDIDIAVTNETWSEESPIYWLEQAPGQWVRHTVGISAMQLSMNAADMDNDGDIDIVAAEGIGRERVQVWENSGAGIFSVSTVDEGKQNHTGTILDDFDNDGDRDIASQSFTESNYMFLWRNDRTVSSGVFHPTYSGPATMKPKHAAYVDLRGRLIGHSGNGEPHTTPVLGMTRRPDGSRE